MFKHILIPTDGSPVSSRAVKAGIRFARALRARVTGYYAVESYPIAYAEGYIPDGKTLALWDRHAMEFGRKHLAAMGKLARAAGVRFDSVCARADTPYTGIVAAVRRKKCDAVFMASHGRSGIARLVMGSVTDKVLKTTKIPVIVYR